MNPHVVQLTAFVVILVIGAAYLVFLYASWHEFQQDRITRDTKIDQLLERIPVPKPAEGTA